MRRLIRNSTSFNDGGRSFTILIQHRHENEANIFYPAGLFFRCCCIARASHNQIIVDFSQFRYFPLPRRAYILALRTANQLNARHLFYRGAAIMCVTDWLFALIIFSIPIVIYHRVKTLCLVYRDLS